MLTFTQLAVFLLSITTVTVKDVGASKRLILDSEMDIEHIVVSLQAEVAQLKTKVTVLESKPTGSTYIRWGRTSCPGNGTGLVHKGYMAGNQWGSYGGGTNHLCLPESPEWANYMEGTASGSTIHGTEIEGDGTLLTRLFGSNIYNQDLSCALCKSIRPSHVMIPGRTTCYAGWTLEYQGYVVTAREPWHGSSEFVCLDANPDLVPHGAGDDEEHIVDVVEVHCGSSGGLPCPPYVQGRELSCVVCSQ